MNVGITAMPDGGVEVSDMGTGLSLISLYKDAVTTTNAYGTQSITATCYTLQMHTMDGLLDEVKNNFDYYWSKAKTAEQDEELATLDEEYQPQFRSLQQSMTIATLRGDTDLETSLKESYTTLESEYTTAREAITNG